MCVMPHKDGQPYKLLEVMGRSILEQFHIEYMNITEEATHKIMEQYRLFFDRTKKYEMKIWTRLQELAPNFEAEVDKQHYEEVLKMLNDMEPEWRDTADKDRRVIHLRTELNCENGAKPEIPEMPK